MNNLLTSRSLASTAAYIGAALFTILIVLFNTMPSSLAIPIVGVAFHVVLFPVVAALPSNDWARAAGYGWLGLDIASNIMLLNGVDENICTALRYGAHIPAIIWIIVGSIQADRLMQIVGILQALVMGSYSFVAPWAPKEMLYPAIILLIIWLILAGRSLSRGGTLVG
jgi:hypothetical protein